ncbi:MAG: prepilin-type N-terminal cleavage/methylation domain-containing protein [Betaproteobacteria bacterium]|nr:prepilin-type N-terminal cleavage/methylation domain-containing protein [Betaproteobacteria bacterium]
MSTRHCAAQHPARLGEGRSISAQRAFTLIEVGITLAIVGLLAVIAIPKYQDYKERALVKQAATDISAMGVLITGYMLDNRVFPETLGDVRLGGKLDPWGRPYVYTNLASAKGKGDARKDKKLNPLNSDFDLYSLGKDGASKPPLSAKVSEDDVIRARDGRFVGLAREFNP